MAKLILSVGFVAIVLLLGSTVRAEAIGQGDRLSIGIPFGSHMVIQQKQSFKVWGGCKPGALITVEIGSQKRSCRGQSDGKWSLLFDSLRPGPALEMKISASGGETLLLEDILVGEVWFCSGQSNMEFRLDQSENGMEAARNACDEQLRLMNYHGIAATADVAWDTTILKRVNHLNYFEGSWQSNSPKEAAAFSAIAWYFGKELRERLGVPVGLVQVAVGGAPAEAFTGQRPVKTPSSHGSQSADWFNNELVMDWCRTRAKKNISLAQDTGQKHPYFPSYIFDAGISSFEGFPVKGVIWYQGESNAHNTIHHEVVFQELITSWRKFWQNDKLPFIFAQLSSIQRPGWELFRDSQRRLAASIPHTAMVVTSDLGDSLNVHPVRKQEVGHRFALQALQKVYGMELKADGPLPAKAIGSKGRTELIFQFADNLKTSDNQMLRELEVAESDGAFHPVTGELSGNKIIIRNESGDLRQIRYGWRPYSIGNLVNEEGLPATTFSITIN